MKILHPAFVKMWRSPQPVPPPPRQLPTPPLPPPRLLHPQSPPMWGSVCLVGELSIALWQDVPPPAASVRGVAWALDALETAAKTAADFTTDLLVLPELFLGGYRLLSEMAHTCALRPESTEIGECCRIARENALAIVLGFYEKGDDGHCYNSALAIDSCGTVKSIYRKTHLFGAAEQAAFTPGHHLAEVFTLCNGVRCCLLVCYDVEFPEAVRSCALAGASLVLTPTANFFPYSFANEPIIRVRAYENHLCVVYANWAEHKNEDGVHFNGQSVVATAEGEFLLMLAASDRGLFLAEALEYKFVRRGGAAAGQGGEQLRDRRPMIYYRTGTEEEGLAARPRIQAWKLAVAGAFAAGLILGALAKKPR